MVRIYWRNVLYFRNAAAVGTHGARGMEWGGPGTQGQSGTGGADVSLLIMSGLRRKGAFF